MKNDDEIEMTPTQFCYFLKGYLTEEYGAKPRPGLIDAIKLRLNEVLHAHEKESGRG